MMVRLAFAVLLLAGVTGVAAECRPFDGTVTDVCERFTIGYGCFETGGYLEAHGWLASVVDDDESGEALFYLGVMHDRGWGTEQSDTEATALFGRSADRGFSASLYNHGMRLLEGIGVEQDDTGAVRFLHLAAEQGVPEAHYVLGLHSILGEVVPPSQLDAYVRLSVAHRLGYETEMSRRYRTRALAYLTDYEVDELSDVLVEAMLEKVLDNLEKRVPLLSDSCREPPAPSSS